MYGGAPYGSRPYAGGKGGSSFQVIYQFVLRFVVYITFKVSFIWKIPTKRFTAYITDKRKFPWRSKS